MQTTPSQRRKLHAEIDRLTRDYGARVTHMGAGMYSVLYRCERKSVRGLRRVIEHLESVTAGRPVIVMPRRRRRVKQYRRGTRSYGNV